MYMRAAYHTDILALSKEDVPISKRVEYLEKAVFSASSACAEIRVLGALRGRGERGGEDGVELEYLKELKTKRDIARLQLQALEQLSEDLRNNHISDMKFISQSKEIKEKNLKSLELIINRLGTQLITISELFNDVAMPFQLWEICFVLMHTTHTRIDNPQLGLLLIRSILYRIIPDHAETQEGRTFLKQKRSNDNIFIDERRQLSSCPFEHTSLWQPKLTKDLVLLGSQVHGPEGDSSFPLALLVEELEDIAAALMSCNSPFMRGWTVDCTLKMGVTYGEILECLMSFSDRWGSKVSEKHTHLLFSISYALMEWKRVVTISSGTSFDINIDQMNQVLTTGILSLWTEKVRSSVVSLSGGRQSEMSRKCLQTIASEMTEMRIYIDKRTSQ